LAVQAGRQARRFDGQQPDRSGGAVARRVTAAAVRVRRQAHAYKTKITKTMSWYDIPTCKDTGLPVEYLMLRGIFMPGGVSAEQVAYYVDLLKKVRETPIGRVSSKRGRSTRRP